MYVEEECSLLLSNQKAERLLLVTLVKSQRRVSLPIVNVTVQNSYLYNVGVTEYLGARFPDKDSCDTTKVLYRERVSFHTKMQSLTLGGNLADLCS